MATIEAAGGDLLARISDGVAHVTLNRPATLNALSYDMLVGLTDWLAAWEQDDAVRAVVVRGAGEKAFCAGGDIRALYEDARSGTTQQHRRYFEIEYALDFRIHRYPKPYVAVLDGIVMGGGMGIAQGAGLRIAGDRTRMAMPETGIGLFPDVGGSWFLTRQPGETGTWLGLTGAPIKAADCIAGGLADLYLPPAAMAGLDGMVAEAAREPDVLAALRNALAPRSAIPGGGQVSALRPAIDLHFAKPSVAEIIASLRTEDREPYAEWAKSALERLGKCSPTMLCVALEQLRRGRGMALADCFRMELGMVNTCFEQGDFLEGIRALIVDKDNQPRWHPARLADVAPEAVQAFFRERWGAGAHPLAAL
jgi:enoyl-CoA hydratase/carnithine racemase